jgi:hypothetical protein
VLVGRGDARVRDVARDPAGAAIDGSVDHDAGSDRRSGLDGDGRVRMGRAGEMLAERHGVGVVLDDRGRAR